MQSQAPLGDMVSYEIMEKSQDTLIFQRRYGDWWFGAFGGPQYDIYFGDLNMNLFASEPNNPFNSLINYSGGAGAGIFLGLMGEYIPPQEKWAYQLRLSLLNFKNGASNTENLPDSLNTSFRFASQLNYISLSPSARYNLMKEGLHIFGGLDLGLALSGDFDQEKYFVNTGDIDQITFTDLNNLKFRIGAHFGVGYDIFMADISNKLRVRFTPFAAMDFGTSYISDNNSSWNSVNFKAGLQIKFGFDKIQYDTLFYDPSAIPAPEYLASAIVEEGVYFPGVNLSEVMPSATLDIVYVTKLQEVEKPIADTLIVAKADVPIDVPETETKINIRQNSTQRFTFRNSTSAELSNEAKAYLDEVAKYMKANPNTIVRVVGHTDNTGPSIEIRQARSEQRAEAATRYLMSKNISRGRILATGRGSLSPFRPNTTVEGRRANNRVEIVVVPN